MNLVDVPTLTLEMLAAILAFWVDFGADPRSALARFPELHRPNIELLWMMAVALATSTFVVLVADRLGWKAVPRVTEQIFGPLVSRFTSAELNAMFLPPAVALIAFFTTLGLHAVLAPSVWFAGRIGLIELPNDSFGSLFNTFNGSLAFLAFFIPIGTLVAIVAGSLPQDVRDGVGQAAGIGLGLVVAVYYPLALAASHPNMTYLQVMTALGVAPWVFILAGALMIVVFQRVRHLHIVGRLTSNWSRRRGQH